MVYEVKDFLHFRGKKKKKKPELTFLLDYFHVLIFGTKSGQINVFIIQVQDGGDMNIWTFIVFSAL